MDKKPLIVVSLCAVVLLVLGSLSNVIGYQSLISLGQNDSPVFSVRTQKVIHHPRNLIISHYLGEGKEFKNDTTPPVTICNLDPPSPDGENGWYVSIINVTLIAIDDDSGVNITKYQIDGGSWQTYIQPFNYTLEGQHILRYFSVDNAGNTEPTKNTIFTMDRTQPQLEFVYNFSFSLLGWGVHFSANATDSTSGMNKVEYYIGQEKQATIVGPGPMYLWDYPCWYMVKGFIRNLEVTKEYVKFNAIVVTISGFPAIPLKIEITAIAYDTAGNCIQDTIQDPGIPMNIITPGLYLFEEVTLPARYQGFIGEHFIRALFYNTYWGPSG